MEARVPASKSSESSTSGGDDRASYITAMIDLLLTVSLVDGFLHPKERAFVQQYIDSVLLGIEQSAPLNERAGLRVAWQEYFEDLFGRLNSEIVTLALEAESVDGSAHIPTSLWDRAFALFGDLEVHDQKTALELLHALIHCDGTVTPAEQNLYQKLTSQFATEPVPGPTNPTVEMPALVDTGAAPPAAEAPTSASLIIRAPMQNPLLEFSHPLLDPLEQTYSPHPVERKSQVEWDFQLVQAAIKQWGRQRAGGTGRLAGLKSVDQLPAGTQFLDGHVHVLRTGQPVELVVLGDLHGCYSCLKAALLQSNFAQRAWAHQWDPQNYPDVKLVLLGDYIDRGFFSFDGVLRAALHLYVSMPDQVILLRGNHEYLRYEGNRIISGVYPAEALASIEPHVPPEMIDAYRFLFEQMPNSFLCDQTIFVHGGIPRDDTFADSYRDLSSLNDAEMRFQMMWSDPVKGQHVPVTMQQQNPRFSFGHNQFKAFMERAGLHTMVRGHEKMNNGFQVVYDLDDYHLITLFSAGGAENTDLPPDSSYRSVTPMALTMQYGNGTPTATPWPIEYQPFNYPPHNGLYRPHPVLEFRYVGE